MPTDPNEVKKFGVSIRNSFRDRLEEFARTHNTDVTTVFRDGAENYANGYLPVLGTIPCGPLAEAIEATKYFEVVPPYLKPRADLGDFLLEAVGDSMAPKIERGDLVLLRPGIEPAAGDVCAVQIFKDGEQEGPVEATLKCYYPNQVEGTVVLKPINPTHPEMVLDARRVTVLAVYKGLIKK